MSQVLRVYSGGSWHIDPIVHVYKGGVWQRAKRLHVYTAGAWRVIHDQTPPPAGPNVSVAQTATAAGSLEVNYKVTWVTDPNYRTQLEIKEGTNPISYVVLAKGADSYTDSAPDGTQVCVRAAYMNDINETGTWGAQDCVTLMMEA